MDFSFYAGWSEPSDRPPRAAVPQRFVDGVATDNLALTYPTELAAIGTSHVYELRYGSTVVASYTVQIIPDGDCFLPPDQATTTSLEESLCAYDSGDLRFGSMTAKAMKIDGSSGFCTGDGFCSPSCSCGSNEHCTARVMLLSPMFSHLGCAPIGPKLAGDPCTFMADPDGAYDDCGANLVCVAGTCRVTCSHSPCATGTCQYVDGYPPELEVCM